MGRRFIDCREFPSEMNCSVALSADSEDELLEAAVQHAVAVHGHEDTPDLRDMIRSVMRDGTPPVEAPQAGRLSGLSGGSLLRVHPQVRADNDCVQCRPFQG